MKKQIEVIDGTPHKRFILSIVSDYDLNRSICELVDNATDIWIKNGKSSTLNIKINFDQTQKTILPEFQLFFNKGWYCRTNVLQDNEINGKGIKLMRAKFSPRNYKFDAVLHKNNKVYCIMEYDGLDHFRPRNTSSNFVLKLTSDQVKCAFVDYLEKNNEPIKTPIVEVKCTHGLTLFHPKSKIPKKVLSNPKANNPSAAKALPKISPTYLEYTDQLVPNSNSIIIPVATPIPKVSANNFIQNRVRIS